MQVEQVGAGRRGNRLTPPGAMSPGTLGKYGVQGGSGPGADAELQLSPSCGLLPPLGHAAYTCTCWFRTARPGATPPSCWACLPAGIGGASCELHQGRQGEWRGATASCVDLAAF